MILVVLAIGTGLSPFDSYNIWPVSSSIKIASLAVIAGGVPLTVRIGLGLGVGVGVKGFIVGVGVEVDPSKRRFPIGVKVKTGTRIRVLIEMNSRAIAIVRRIIILQSGPLPDLFLPRCSHCNAGNLYYFGPTGVIVGNTLEGIGDTQKQAFGEEVPQKLQTYRKTITETAGDRDPANTCQVCRNGEYVLEIHFVRIGYLTNFECHGG